MNPTLDLTLEVFTLLSTFLIAAPAVRISYDLAFVERATRYKEGDSERLTGMRESTHDTAERATTRWNRRDHVCLVSGVLIQVIVSIVKLSAMWFH